MVVARDIFGKWMAYSNAANGIKRVYEPVTMWNDPPSLQAARTGELMKGWQGMGGMGYKT